MKQASDRLEAMEAAMALSMGPGWKRRVSAIVWRGGGDRGRAGEGGEGVVVERWSGAEERREGVTARRVAQSPPSESLAPSGTTRISKTPATRTELPPPHPHRNPQ